MITVIICSIDADLRGQCLESIEKTIGVEYEVVCIDNSVENLTIAQAYNKGGKAARFEHLVFVHEDVIFRTEGWGKLLIDAFYALESPGIVGIAASAYQPISPTGWWVTKNKRLRIIQSDRRSDQYGNDLNVNGDDISQVFVVDGVFLSMTKDVFMDLQFDEQLPGFHGYDVSISLRATRKYRNYFLPGIILEHLSNGSPNSNWVDNNISIIETFSGQLPLSLNGQIDANSESMAFAGLLQDLELLDASKLRKARIGSRYLRRILLVDPVRSLYQYLRFLAKLLIF